MGGGGLGGGEILRKLKLMTEIKILTRVRDSRPRVINKFICIIYFN